MTATGDNTLKQNQGNNTAPSPGRPAPQRDLIPVWLLIGIFAFVLAIMVVLLKDNWHTDWTRFQSMKAQQNREYKKAITLLEKLRAEGKKSGYSYIEFSPTYLSEIAYSYQQLGDYDKALQYYQLAQENHNNVPADESGNPRPPLDFHSNIGYTYYLMGKHDEARAALQKALVFNKLDPQANFVMGEMAMKQGDYTGAADYFKIVAADPRYEDKVKKHYAEIEEKLFAGIE